MHAPTPKPAHRIVLLLLCIGLAALLNIAGWWWFNRPERISDDPQARINQISSVSFAPFRRGQGPLVKIFPTPEQVEEDLASLKGVVKGVRTYTALEGVEIVPQVAGRYGIEVTHSAWLGRELDVNEKEITALIEQANRYPDTIKRVIVGNEVLLRKDLTADQLIGYIRRVKAAVKQPVSYADVWEFWLQNPRLLDEVDFVTVHFLPYWEDLPVGVEHAMEHILWVYDTVRQQLPGKPVMIGEVGWPSEGRSRRDAVPSRVDAAKFILAFLRLAEEKGLDYNLVEAFDQPWKVALEGTVGGAWGVLDEFRNPKYELHDGKLSELPQWPLIAGMALLIALILIIPQAQRIVALPPARMLALSLFAQAMAALLAATIEHGLEHNYSALRFAEFVVMGVLQAIFASLLFNELLDRLEGRRRTSAPLRALGLSLAEICGFGRLYLPFGRNAASQHTMTAFQALRRTRLAEWLFTIFALAAVYQCVMLVAAGRYRDFPIDYYLLPILGFVLMRVLAAVFGDAARGARLLALGGGFVDLPPQAPRQGRFTWEAVLCFLLFAVPVLVMVVEKLSNREALYWSLIAAAYGLPLLANLLTAGRHKGIAESGLTR
jgi:exo-beta-1,3-glucanase (GH17 family)